MFTGADKTNASPGPTAPYNSYRFNGMQWDPGSGQYNMGFRNYDAGTGTFTTRDMYAGSGADMALAGDPFSGGAYAFGDANPISNIELDGHMIDAGNGCIGGLQAVIACSARQEREQAATRLITGLVHMAQVWQT
jgi:RHS repeat-associated protein